MGVQSAGSRSFSTYAPREGGKVTQRYRCRDGGWGGPESLTNGLAVVGCSVLALSAYIFASRAAFIPFPPSLLGLTVLSLAARRRLPGVGGSAAGQSSVRKTKAGGSSLLMRLAPPWVRGPGVAHGERFGHFGAADGAGGVEVG